MTAMVAQPARHTGPDSNTSYGRRWGPGARSGFTLMELGIVMTVIGILATIGISGMQRYAREQEIRSAAQAMTWAVTLTRSYAIRSGSVVVLSLNRGTRKVEVRSKTGTKYYLLDLSGRSGPGTGSITLNVPGDSLVFSGRGVCVNCPLNQPTEFLLTLGTKTKRLQVTVLGRARVVS
jgi:prepilin-type N-terminal cleavage/methylation domain-containing protein